MSDSSSTAVRSTTLVAELEAALARLYKLIDRVPEEASMDVMDAWEAINKALDRERRRSAKL